MKKKISVNKGFLPEYKVTFHRDQSEYYLDNDLLFKVRTKVSFFGFSSTTRIYKEGTEVFCFYEKAITILFWRLKIITQNLEKDVYLEKKKLQYHMVVDNKRLLVRFNSNPFSEKIGEFYLEDSIVGNVTRVKKTGGTSFFFNFFEDVELKYYFLILFAMCSIGITSD